MKETKIKRWNIIFVDRKNVLLEHVLVWVKLKKEKQIVKKYDDDAANNTQKKEAEDFS